ncbi:MAG: alanine:cation symporter family protein [Tissierellales bacterium]|jgi:AGCS family alanine or glycine:cation symporter|nr:alanine:cation symporter family protein [Tissierellales bacterium]
MYDILNSFVNTGNTILWSYVLIFMLITLGLYFTIRTGGVQFRMLPEMIRLLTEGASSKGKKGVSSVQAFCISTASRVGTGNLAGVALAIAAGGPGAVFWMWVIALIGAGSSFVESTLAQIYKVKDGDGYRGGPAYYMEKALGAKWMGIAFSILITLCFGLVFNAVQSNTIAAALNESFGIDKIHMGIALAVFTAIIIFGGVHRIAKVTEVIVPVMAVAYLCIAGFVIVKNISMIPGIFSLIFESAFGIRPFGSAVLATVVTQGVKRGLFSNEAGMGSAPNAAATAEVSHPVKQGLIQTLGVFTDTILICTATSFLILISGVYQTGSDKGIELTQTALSSQVGAWGGIFISICILLFAFSSIVGNYYYGETNIEFMNSNKVLVTIYRLAVVYMVFWGAGSKIDIVWNLADLFMGSMAIINLIAILLLGKFAFAALKDYQIQKKAGKNPVFKASSIKGLKNTECWDDEDSDITMCS